MLSPFQWANSKTHKGTGIPTTDIMDAALRMRPETKRMALIAGTSPNDAFSEQICL